MKILVVSQYFWPENFRVNDLVLGLMERGHVVTVLTGKPNYPSGRLFPGYGLIRGTMETYHGAEVRRVPLLPRGNGGAIRLLLNYASFAISATILGPFLCRDKYDAIFVYEPSPITVGLPALWLKRLRAAPLFFWVLDLWPESLSAAGAVRSAWVLRWVERLVRFIYRGCDRILVQSRAFYQPIQTLGVNPARILYFPNSAEPLFWPLQSNPNDRALTGLPDGFVVMFAGNIGAAQDFPAVLTAAERLKERPDIHWVILGDGRLASWAREEVSRRGLGGTVHFIGSRPLEQMPAFFANADVMLASLKRDPLFALTIPGKVQSYLACGRPIVGMLDGEGARVINEAQAGSTCPAGDADGLAARVLDLYRMGRAERERLGANGRAYYLAHFERETLLDRLEDWMVALSVRREPGPMQSTSRN